MPSIVGILVALLVAALVYVVAALFLPSPIPLIAALLVFLLGALGGWGGSPGWRRYY